MTPTPCRTRSIYLTVNGRRYGIELESRARPRYAELRLTRRARVKILTYRA